MLLVLARALLHLNYPLFYLNYPLFYLLYLSFNVFLVIPLLLGDFPILLLRSDLVEHAFLLRWRRDF